MWIIIVLLLLGFAIYNDPWMLVVLLAGGIVYLFLYAVLSSMFKGLSDRFVSWRRNWKRKRKALTSTVPSEIKTSRTALQGSESAASGQVSEYGEGVDADSSSEQRYDYRPFITVRGITEEERALVRIAFEIQDILLYGLSHRVEMAGEGNLQSNVLRILECSQYPFDWNREIRVELNGGLLVVDYRLPSIDDMPEYAEIAFRRCQPVISEPSEKRRKELWSQMCYMMVIRVLHELFSLNDRSLSLEFDSISLNGYVRTLDEATGHVSEKCIMSVMAKRELFLSLDLTRVDPKQCFKRLKGVCASDLASLTPIPPIVQLRRDDDRFSEAHEVIAGMAPGENLAAMDWREFENLIRDLFEKEYSSDGSEVRITRASKDGGVDAVVFDSDPIRGGKIIIQAKRYTNTVGVSAVRDLYGTVLNEGAMKGILVTTSDYGSDSYNFAKDKPLSLLNGANLLFLLDKHGHKARIDLDEARKFLNSVDYEQ